ncbi:hypothetical protein RHSIM_Rhsim05G0096000 [Rhododendron simsii]|uniref:GAG-pre-integrase domain-containing protein n=1 Tax=Rhododendron simsii TaxID=118357 RepID=A0A834H3Q8_RHOSS|nr:hypothetical protein RHSIM_Rhsim05G0096000 [Rhododendron simsii]
MNVYYTKLKGLWDLHDALCPLPPCSGDTAKELHQHHQKQRTIKFLMGLNGVYTAARGQILLMEPLPTVNKVYSLIIQDEKQRVISSQAIGMAPKVAAFAVKDGSHYLSKNPHLRYDRCDATGHTSDSCRAHLKCDYCGWKGHAVDICRKFKRATSNGNKGNHQDRKLNLISMTKLTKTSSCYAVFTDEFCFVQDQRSRKMIGMGTEREGLYYLDVAKKAGCYSISASNPTSSRLWHQHLGHLSNKSLRAISLCTEIMHFCSIDDCSICPLAQETRNPFPLSSINTKAPFELIHVDIWGGYHVPTLDGARYFLTIVDDYSRCTWVYLLNHKSDTRRFLTTFINLVETQFESCIKIIRSDSVRI